MLLRAGLAGLLLLPLVATLVTLPLQFLVDPLPEQVQDVHLLELVVLHQVVSESLLARADGAD